MSNQQKDQQAQPDQSVASPAPGNRRRGKILEDAILQAAWNELSEFGYNRLTMEGVAARARTNKAVVYRRWPNKAKLVVAVLGKHLPKPFETIPNTGELRRDVFELLDSLARPMHMVGAETLQGLMADYGQEVFSSLPEKMPSRGEDKLTATMMTILKHAEARGEICLAKISPRIISLPMDLLRYEFLITQEPLLAKTISEIVDDIFMPLVKNSK